MLVDQVMFAGINRTTGQEELEAWGKRKAQKVEAWKRGREAERKRERERTFPSISIWRCVERPPPGISADLSLFYFIFFYLMYIHDRVSHDDIGLWDWITHIRHAINIHIHIHLHVQVERSPKRAVLRTACYRGREHISRSREIKLVEMREKESGWEGEKEREWKRTRETEGRKIEGSIKKNETSEKHSHTVLSSRWLYILVLCISFRVLASYGWERERNRWGVRWGYERSTKERKGDIGG